MFERFTYMARRTVVHAQVAARDANHHCIGTEHLILGLLSDELRESDAGRVLAAAGCQYAAAFAAMIETIGKGESPPFGHLPFTVNAKKMLELSLREALELGDGYIGTGHLALAVTRMDPEGTGDAAILGVSAPLDLRLSLIEGMRAGGPSATEEARSPADEERYRAYLSHAAYLRRLPVLLDAADDPADAADDPADADDDWIPDPGSPPWDGQPWAFHVEHHLAEDPGEAGVPDEHWTWELCSPDEVVRLSGTDTDDPRFYLSRIAELLDRHGVADPARLARSAPEQERVPASDDLRRPHALRRIKCWCRTFPSVAHPEGPW